MSEPYLDPETCPECKGVNQNYEKRFGDHQMTECKTKCNQCNHEDYWTNGSFKNNHTTGGNEQNGNY